MKPDPLIQTTIHLRKDQIRSLKYEAIEIDKNMSAIVRELIDKHYEKDNQYLIEESEKYPGCFNIYDKNNKTLFSCDSQETSMMKPNGEGKLQ